MAGYTTGQDYGGSAPFYPLRDKDTVYPQVLDIMIHHSIRSTLIHVWCVNKVYFMVTDGIRQVQIIYSQSTSIGQAGFLERRYNSIEKFPRDATLASNIYVRTVTQHSAYSKFTFEF